MEKAPLPENEEQRLATLHSLALLDTPREERFDRLTRMARRVFRAPIALVSLVDHGRQWFKSCIGLDSEETARDISFCGHAILADEVFVIPDARTDPRFRDNPLVIGEPKIRFYAGCPLRAFDGSRIGTLCIIDHEPRKPDAEDIMALRDLAAMVEQEIAAIQIATIDELTGLGNRRGFMILAEKSLHICNRQSLTATLVSIDLDDFKSINDRYGHVEGDRALAVFAGELRKSFRASDICARIGGDEFVVLLTDASSADATAIVRRFERALSAHNRRIAPRYELSMSFGIVQYDRSRHGTLDALLRDGDAAMYECKRRHKSDDEQKAH
jgi:diguanylate cyclase (GGDEF)-like protein